MIAKSEVQAQAVWATHAILRCWCYDRDRLDDAVIELETSLELFEADVARRESPVSIPTSRSH